jgi:Protein NO VEIN, C-terminal
MPHNNPGYDIRIDAPDGPCYIELKGTTRPSPRFLLSDGERPFSIKHADRYSPWIFSSIDTQARTGALVEHAGAVASPRSELLPIQYARQLIS